MRTSPPHVQRATGLTGPCQLLVAQEKDAALGSRRTWARELAIGQPAVTITITTPDYLMPPRGLPFYPGSGWPMRLTP